MLLLYLKTQFSTFVCLTADEYKCVFRVLKRSELIYKKIF